MPSLSYLAPRLALAGTILAATLLAPAHADTTASEQVVRATGKPGRLESASLTVTATVENVDYGARRLTLKNAEGRLLTIDVAPEIKRLDEVKKGDTLEIEYLEAIAVSVHAPTEPAEPGNQAYSVIVRNPTASPSGRMIDTEISTVTVDAIDTRNRIAELVREDGSRFRVGLGPEVQRIEEIRKGDRVVVRYTRSVALSVHQPGAR